MHLHIFIIWNLTQEKGTSLHVWTTKTQISLIMRILPVHFSNSWHIQFSSERRLITVLMSNIWFVSTLTSVTINYLLYMTRLLWLRIVHMGVILGPTVGIVRHSIYVKYVTLSIGTFGQTCSKQRFQTLITLIKMCNFTHLLLDFWQVTNY